MTTAATGGSFSFVIDRYALLQELPSEVTDTQVEISFEGAGSQVVDWTAVERDVELTYQVVGRQEASVIISVSDGQNKLGGSVKTTVRQGSRVCLFSQAQLDACAGGSSEDCLCADARLCRDADDQTTLALYNFDTPENDGLPGDGFGVEDTERYPAEKLGSGASLVRDETSYLCDAGGSLTRSAAKPGEYLQVYPHSRMEGTTALDKLYADLRFEFYALEFAAYLHSGGSTAQTIVAATSGTDLDNQFQVAAMPNGDLRLRMNIAGIPGYYCASDALGLDAWTTVGLNLRNSSPEVFISGREVDIDQSGENCESGAPGSLFVTNNPLSSDSPITIGVSFHEEQGVDWMGPALRVDQLRLLHSRL